MAHLVTSPYFEQMLKRLFSPSMAIALLALVVALSGVSYAAVMINGRDIQKGSMPGNRLKTDTVGGSQVNEAKLGSVPRAQDANTLDGVDSSGFVKGGGV